MNWQEALKLGCANADEQHRAWSAIVVLRARIRAVKKAVEANLCPECEAIDEADAWEGDEDD